MTAAIAFIPNFPHATIEGHELGCVGNICPGKHQYGWSCADARTRYNGDYQWRMWVLAGMTPADIVDAQIAEVMVAREQRAAVRAAVKAAKRKQDRRLGPRTPAPIGRPAKPFTHGTIQGYRSGCRTDADCPNTVTCRQFKNEYNRLSRERLKQDLAGRKHGTVGTYGLGCSTETMCPNYGSNRSTCAEIGRAAAMAHYYKEKVA
jgi:hypothetical protein